MYFVLAQHDDHIHCLILFMHMSMYKQYTIISVCIYTILILILVKSDNFVTSTIPKISAHAEGGDVKL